MIMVRSSVRCLVGRSFPAVRAMRSAHRPRQAGAVTQRTGSGNDSCDTSWFGRGAFPSNPRPAQPSVATDLIAFQV